MQYLTDKQKYLESIQDKKIILFGTGYVSKIITPHIPFDISYYIDNDSEKWNTTFMGAIIHGPDILKKESKEQVAIFIASSYYEQVAVQLHELGYAEGIHFWGGMAIFQISDNKALMEKSPEILRVFPRLSQTLAKFFLKNVALKNIHQNKRCFILGNGPSLANQDLTLLKNDIKIVVSSFYRHPQMEEIHPEYWVVADPLFWQQPENTLDPLLNALQSKRFRTKFFMPSEGASLLIERADAGANVDPHIFHYNHNLTGIEDIDLSQEVPPWGQNVICTALMLAFHLGCSDIYLMGCDHTWWEYTKEKYVEDALQHAHFYQNPVELKLPTFPELLTYEELQQAIMNQRRQYELLKAYGEKKHQHVYNATQGGLLDIFPRIHYESLF
ncbi:MAG: hypothetical protein K0Q65_1187 [Clostridia bacterium]|nr:hypothetical protein [Clostridia bacterium]